MPLWYKGIVDEHLAVRNACGIFDVSHMGRVWIKGKDATRFLNYLLPTDPAAVKNYRAFYSVLCNFNGGIVDDVITNKFSAELYLMVVNAGNREKDLRWLKETASGYDVIIEDFSDDSGLIAVQGPFASAILQKICDIDLTAVKRFALAEGYVAGQKTLLSRTGYTGEDGFEITVFESPLENPEKVSKVWNSVLEAGADGGILPCGLGARDSLRLEAGLCLYGQDIDETTTPVEASLEAVISKDQRDFIGKKKIEEQLASSPPRKRVCFSMTEPGIPRHGHDVFFAGQKVGQVTSGTFSPILKNGIGMACVPTPLSNLGQSISIKIRDIEKRAETRAAPFYDKTKYGYRRQILPKS